MDLIIRRESLIRAGIFTALLVGSLLSGCSGRASERDRLQGDTYLQIGRYDEAVEAYRSAIERDDKNPLARLGLGRTLAARGNEEEALAAFRETVEVAPDFDLGYLEIVNALHQLDRNTEALAEAKAFEDVNPTLGGVLRASLLRRTGNIDEATNLLKALRESDPESAVAQTHLASALLAAGDSKGAEAILQTLPVESTGANVLMADVLGAQGRVRELIERNEEIHERSNEESLVLAYALIRDGQTDEGLSMVRTTQEQDPSSSWANYIRGTYLSEQGQTADAMPLLRAAANDLPWEPLVMHSITSAPYAVSSTVSPTEPSPAVDATTAIEAIDLDWQSLWRKASLRRLVDERQRLLDKNEKGLAEALILSACLLDDLELAQSLAGETPKDSPLRAYLAALAKRDAQAAIEALKPWNDREGHEQILAMNATAYAMGLAGARNSAVQVLSECYRRYPENGVSLFNLANVFRGANMPEFATHALRRLIANAPDSLEAHLFLFQVLRESGPSIEARQAAEVMYALFPNSREAALAACGIYVDSGHVGVARRVVENYLDSNDHDMEMKLALAAILFREDRVDDALSVLTELDLGDVTPSAIMLTALCHAYKRDWQRVIDTAASTDPETMPFATRLILVAAHIETGQKKIAGKFLVQESEGGPITGIILNALGEEPIELPDRQRQFSEALASNDRALSDFVAGLAFQEARLHDAAFQKLREVDSAIAVENDFLLGYLFSSLAYVTRLKAKEESLAIVEKHAENPRAWLGHASISEKAGDLELQRIALDKALEVGTEDPLVLMQRGDFFSNQNEFDAAISEYRQLLKLNPDDPVGNNNLAYNLLLTGGDPEEAMKAAERAAEGLPNDAHVLHTLGVAQLRAGQLDESKQSLAKALERRPGDPELLFDYGKLLIERGEDVQGVQYLKSALNTTQSLELEFDRKEEAEAILTNKSAT